MSSLDLQFLTSNSYSTQKYIEYLGSFSLSNWCGMPHCLNPRKLVNMGFKCVGPRQVQCIEPECAQTAIVSEDVPFENSGGPLALRFLQRLQGSTHNFTCKWNQPAFV